MFRPVELLDENNKTKTLCMAAEQGRVKVVRALLEEPSCNPNAHAGQSRQTALHMAASEDDEDHIEIAGLLLRYGTLVNSKDAIGWTPLHTATSKGNVDMMTFLLRKNALINAVTDGGDTALHLAIVNMLAESDSDIYRMAITVLVENGASSKIKNTHKKTPLDYLVEQADIDFVKNLYRAKADLAPKCGRCSIV